MHILHVHVKIKPERIDEFVAATLSNAKSSLEEPGCVRFDVLQEVDDPAHFELHEAYRDQAGHAAHRDSAHYKAWAEAVADLFAEPRTRTIYRNLYPADSDF